MSTRSPAISLDTACTREPRMPTQAPTGSMRGSLLRTAILARMPGVAGGAQDLDGALAHFRHFQLEQLDQELGSGARQEQLRTTRLVAHILEVCLDAILRLQRLARNQVGARDEPFGIVAQVHEDAIAVDALDHAR